MAIDGEGFVGPFALRPRGFSDQVVRVGGQWRFHVGVIGFFKESRSDFTGSVETELSQREHHDWKLIRRAPTRLYNSSRHCVQKQHTTGQDISENQAVLLRTLIERSTRGQLPSINGAFSMSYRSNEGWQPCWKIFEIIFAFGLQSKDATCPDQNASPRRWFVVSSILILLSSVRFPVRKADLNSTR
jgi:hypothetical protein